MKSSVTRSGKPNTFNVFIQFPKASETGVGDTPENAFAGYEENSLQSPCEDMLIPNAPFQDKNLLDEAPKCILKEKEEERAKRIQPERRNSELEAENVQLKDKLASFEEQFSKLTIEAEAGTLDKKESKEKDKETLPLKVLWIKFTNCVFMYTLLWWIWDTYISNRMDNKILEGLIEQLFSHFEMKICKSLTELISEFICCINLFNEIPDFVSQGKNKLIAEGLMFLCQVIFVRDFLEKVLKKVWKVLLEENENAIEYDRVVHFVFMIILELKDVNFRDFLLKNLGCLIHNLPCVFYIILSFN